jgi:hypothetical protein
VAKVTLSNGTQVEGPGFVQIDGKTFWMDASGAMVLMRDWNGAAAITPIAIVQSPAPAETGR